MFEAGFMDGTRGGLFYVLHVPAVSRTRGVVLFVHPFAEEMNKSRRMVATQARALAQQGFVVLIPDHYGCGDSEGDFGDAEWGVWVEDLRLAASWLQERYDAPLVLWGLRTGCLLISELIQHHGIVPQRCLFWQPVTNGEQYLTQFLRLRIAAGMLAGEKESAKGLRQCLSDGQPLEVAGYRLPPAVAEPLAKARLACPPCPVDWLEVVLEEGAELPPASARTVDAWREEGGQVAAAVVLGEPFWNTQEIREAPELVQASLDPLREAF
jgi:exosortase A-associated hydrolase 2